MPFDGPFGTTGTVRVILHGRLRRRFGRQHDLGISTAAEAFRALGVTQPGFREAIYDGAFRVVRGRLRNGMEMEPIDLHLRLVPGQELHVVPVPKGGKEGGVGKIILGATIMIAAAVLSIPTGGTSLALGAEAFSIMGASISYGNIFMFGAAMFLSGISQLISPQPKRQISTTKDDQSFLLGGNINSYEQGLAVPLIYGKVRVGSVVASIGYSAEEYQPAPATDTGSSSPPDVESSETPGYYEEAAVEQLPPVEGGGSGEGGGGGGKGGGGGGHVAREAPNTLRSRAVVRIIDVLGEGPILGLVDGAKSIFFDGTPLQAADGTWNFKGVSWEVRTGEPDQDPVSGYPAAEQSMPVNLEAKAASPVTQTVTSATATAARVTVRLPALYQQTPEGDLNPAPTLAYTVSVRPVGGAWTTVADELITNGKCTSPYERSHRFDLPYSASNSWDIRLTRVTEDSETLQLSNETWWGALDLITDHQLIYPNTAYVALTIDSEAFGSRLPNRTYEVNGMLVQVPMNYDPVTRTYATTGPGTTAGSWNGSSWKLAWTDNNAWILWDIVTATRYALGLPASALAATKWDLYDISQYCDGQVPTGFAAGGTEPRYTLNQVISDQKDAYRVLQEFVSTFRGMFYWAGGSLCFTADKPATPVKLLNQANVLGGDFSYEGTSLAGRHNAARVSWRDPNDGYAVTIEVVEDYSRETLPGHRIADITGFGVTSRGLAHRLGKWLIDTDNNSPETANFAVSIDNMDLRPGDVFYLADPEYAGVRMGGRVRGGNTTTRIYLDATVAFGAETWSISVLLPDGTAALDRAVSSTGTASGASYVNLGTPLFAIPQAGTPFVLKSTSVAPRQFRVAGVAETKPGEYSVVALRHDPTKYDRIELGLVLPEPSYSTLQDQVTGPLPRIGERAYACSTTGGTTVTLTDLSGLEPGMLVSAEEPYPAETEIVSINSLTGAVVLSASRTGGAAYTGPIRFIVISAASYLVGIGTTTVTRTTVSWYQPNDIRVDRVEIRAYTAERIVGFFTSAGASADIDSLPPGTYRFGVRAVARDGRSGAWVDSHAIEVTGQSQEPPAVAGLTAVGGTRRIQLTWGASEARDLKHYEIWRKVGGTTPGANPTTVPGAEFLRFSGSSSATDNDSAVLLPNTTAYYWVRAISTTDVAGAWAGPATATTTLLLTDDLADAIISAAKFASSIKPVEIIANLSVTKPDQAYAVNAIDGKLYRRNGASWVAVTDAAEITGTITSAQIASLAATKITGQLTDSQLAAIAAAKVTGTLTSSQIADLAITPAKLAAAAVTADKLAGAYGANWVWNPCGAIASDGWAGIAGVGGNLTVASQSETNWSLEGQGSLVLRPNANLPPSGNSYVEAAWRPAGSNPNGIPVRVGDKVAIQAELLPRNGVTARLLAYWVDASNATFSLAHYGSAVSSSSATDGKALASYTKRSAIIGPAPAGTVRVEFRVRLSNETGSTINLAADPCLVFTRVGVGPAPANATEVPDWSPGAATELPGGMIRAGTLTNAQIADLAAIKITGTLTDAQIAALSAIKITGTITSAQIADLAAAKVTGTLTNAQIADLAATKITGTLTNAQIADLAATKITGTLTSAQIADLAATKITGTLSDAQIAALAATKITGALTSSQIADLAATKITGTLTSAQIADLAATKITGTLSDAQIAALAATKITGVLSTSQIADLAITQAKVADAAIIASKLATAAVTPAALSFGLPTNMVWNPCFGISADGWVNLAGVGGTTTIAALSDTDWSLGGYGSGVLKPNGNMAHNSYTELYWRPTGSNPAGTPIRAGDKVAVQAELLPKNGVVARLLAYWIDSNNAGTLALYGSAVPSSSATDGKVLENYTRASSIIGPAPAGTVRVALAIRMSNESGSTINLAANPFVVVTRVGVSVVPANATAAPDWSPGAATELPGGMIRAGSLTNAQIADLAATKITGTLTSAQIADLAATKITGTLSDAQIAALAATKITGTLTSAQIADLAATKITGTLSDAQIVALAATKITGTLSDSQIAALAATKITGTLTNAQIADLAATKITGTLSNAQIADLAAAKITGTLTNAQIADLAAIKITGTLTYAQIADLAATKITGTLTDAQIASLAATKITGTLTDAQLAGLSAAKLTGQIVSTQITDGAISTPKLAAGAVTAGTIAAGAITTAKLAAGAVTANELGADAVTAVKIAAGAITTAKLAAGAVTASELGANSVTAAAIAAGAITTAKITAGAVTATELAADAVTATKIAAGAITTAKLAAGAVTAATLGVGLPSNVIWNSTPGLTPDGWSLAVSAGSGGFITPVLGSSYDPTWVLPAQPGFALGAASLNNNGYAQATWNPDGTPAGAMPVSPGTRVEFQASVAIPTGFRAIIYCRFANSAGSEIGVGGYTTFDGTGPANGQTLGQYTTISDITGGAPANTVSATMVLRFQNLTGSTAAGAFGVFTRMALGVASANQSEVSPWAPGGVTQISGGVIRTGSIYARAIAAGTITAAEIASSTITGDRLAANTITAGQIASGAITTAKLAAGAITASELGANAVTAAAIAAGAITTSKITAGAITANELATDAVTAAKIAAGAITTAKITAGAVTATELSADAVTAAKIAAGAITTAKIQAGAITANELGADAVTAAKIAAGAITTAKLAAGAVTASELGANSVTAAAIAAGAITTAKLAAGAITANELATDAVTAVKISAGSISTAKIAAGAITGATLGIGLPSNVIWNSCPGLTADGWTTAIVVGTGSTPLRTPVIGSSYAASWTLTGNPGMVLSASSLNNNAYVETAWAPEGASYGSLPVVPGDVVEIQALVATPAGCQAIIYVRWYDNAGGIAGTGTLVTHAGVGPASGLIRANYTRIGGRMTAPAGAAFAMLILRFTNASGGTLSNPFMVITQIAIGLAPSANLTELSPWAPGGVTQISGGVIRTGSIYARSIAAGTITATEIAAATITGAKIAAGTITGAEIAADTITAANIAANAITAGEIAAGAVTTAKLTAGAVTANELAADAVTAVKIAAGAITTAKITAGAVTATELGADAVTAAKIAAGAITTAKITAGAITANELASDAVTAAKIAAGAITTAKITAGAVTASELAANAVTAASIAAGAITTAKIQAGAITTNELATDAVTAVKIAAGAITTAKITAGAITTNELAADAVTAAKIAAGAITTAKITAGAVTANELGADAVTAAKIAAGAITTAKLAAGAVTASELGANSVTAAAIAAGAITTAKLAAGAITANELATDAVTAVKIAAAAITTAKIAAGAITGATLGIGQPENVIWNSCPGLTNDGWLTAVASGSGAFATPVLGSSYDPTWVLPAQPGFALGAASLSNNGYVQAIWAPDGSLAGSLPASPGDKMEVQATVAIPTGYQAIIYCRYINSAGSEISTAAYTTFAGTGPADGRTLAQYTRIGGVTGAAPAGTVAATLVLRFQNLTGSTQANAFGVFTRMGIGVASANQTELSPWAPGGVTQISGGVIRTGSIYARSIATGTLTANEIAANTITGAKVAAGTITGANIAATTITAANIVAGTITATQIASSTITATQIASAAITTAKIAAGAITGATLGIGLPSNVIWNSCPGLTRDGWSTIGGVGGGGGSGAAGVPVLGSSFDPTWVLPGYPGMVLSATSMNNNSFIETYWQPDGANTGLPVVPGDVVEVQALMATQTTSQGIIYLRFYDASNVAIGVYAYTVHTGTGPANGQVRANYTRVGGRATAPANSAYAIVFVRLNNGSGGTISNPFLVVTQIAYGLAPNSSVTELSPWAPGGVTQISGGVIRTGSIQARSIAAGTITATEIAASTITGAKVAAGTITGSNIAANTISAANIVGATITAAEIAANTITAAKIAAGTLTAATLAAGAITASKLTITAGSVLPDTCFDDTVGFWALDAGWAAQDNNGSNTAFSLGVRRAAVLASPTFTGAGQVGISGIAFASCAAGQVYRLRARGSNTNTTRSLLVQIYAVDRLGAITGAAAQVSWLNASASDKEVQFTVPANGVRLAVGVVVPSGAAWSGTAAVGDVTVVQAATGGMIIDGTITASKIAAGTITATQIASDTITAAQIAAGAVGASEIAANVITASHLATSTLITLAAQIGTGVIGTAQIADAAITSAKIGSLQVTSAQIDNLTVGPQKLAYNAATRVSQVHAATDAAYPGGRSPSGGQSSCYMNTTIVVETNGTVVIFIRAALKETATGGSFGGGQGGAGEGQGE
jgi:predicted phage tail protein